MSDSTLPAPRAPTPDAPVRPAALVLTAVAKPPLDEQRPWLEQYEITDGLAVPWMDTPIYLTEGGVALTTTGIGKSDAATTVASLLATPGIDLESAYVLSAGIAGASPHTAALGSVVVADAVIDWDRKHRWDRPTETSDSVDERHAIDTLAYRPRDYVHHLEERLVDSALEAAREVTLQDDPDVRAYQRRYPRATADGPTVKTGTTVCGDEFWHGSKYAREVEWLCEQYGVAPYTTTQMEDAATATALERFGRLEQYLSIRAVANYDRPAPGQSVEESFDGTEASLTLAIENAARVGLAVTEYLVVADPLGVWSVANSET